MSLSDNNALYVDGSSLPKSHSRVCEKFDSCTSDVMKKHIVKSFTEPGGTVHVIFVTIAFAMGLDSPDIRNVVHWGAPTDIETYVKISSSECIFVGRDRDSNWYP